MSKKAALCLSFAVSLGILLLTGCPQHVTINKINGDPGAYTNKEVAVTGTVSRSYGLLGNGVLGWSFVGLDAVLGRGNDYYLATLVVPATTK